MLNGAGDERNVEARALSISFMTASARKIQDGVAAAPVPVRDVGDARAAPAPLVCTIGHSNRPLADFIALLAANRIDRVLDVRTVPRSRHNPQFNRDALPASLAEAGIDYEHLPGLGGLRHPRPDSINGGWRNDSFRGYADYMQTREFADNVHHVVELARSERCALMCAEAVPWRCHRSMIGDALLVRGIGVDDIIGPGARRPHALTAFAHVKGDTITYPPLVEPGDQSLRIFDDDGDR